MIPLYSYFLLPRFNNHLSTNQQSQTESIIPTDTTNTTKYIPTSLKSNNFPPVSGVQLSQSFVASGTILSGRCLYLNHNKLISNTISWINKEIKKRVIWHDPRASERSERRLSINQRQLCGPHRAGVVSAARVFIAHRHGAWRLVSRLTCLRNWWALDVCTDNRFGRDKIVSCCDYR